jgi:hypothetical protein
MEHVAVLEHVLIYSSAGIIFTYSVTILTATL